MNEKIPLLLDETDAATVRRILPKVKVGDVPEGYAANITAAQLLTLIKRADAPFARDLKEVAAMHGIDTEKKRAKKPKQSRLQKMGAAMKNSGFKGTGGYGDNPADMTGKWPATITRFMDDEIYYAKTGKYAPAYLKQNRAPELARFLAKSPQYARAYEEVLKDAWNGRATNPSRAAGDREENPKTKRVPVDMMGTQIRRGAYVTTGSYEIDGITPRVFKVTSATIDRYGNTFVNFLYGDMPVTFYGSQVKVVAKPKPKPKRATNPARAPIELHIDVNSHNTGGRNVRAKNPISESEKKSLGRNWATADKASITSWPDGGATVRLYWKDGAAVAFEAPSHEAGRAKLVELGLAQEHGSGRAKNPATVHNKSRGAASLILKLAGHPKGAGYWTGTEWDTTKAKARRFDTMAGAVAVGKKLAADLPASYRIEVHAAGK